MRPLTETLPKALLPVNGRPFAHYQLRWLALQGVREIVYSIAYKGRLIRDAIGSGDRWGLRVRYVDEGDQLRGTAGALRLALDVGALADRFFVLYGDSFLPIAMPPVAEAFERSGSPALMTVLRNHDRWDASNVTYEGGRVVLYDKRRRDSRAHAMEFIDYGLCILARHVIQRVPPGTVADLADFFHVLSEEGALAGYEVTQRFYEIGSIAGLRDFQRYLEEGSFPSG